MWAIITKPFAWLMVKLYELTGNYGVAVILFALVVNLILSPFMAKSKKSMMRQTRIQPQLQELQRRHEGNPQKLNQEMQKLYREEGIHPRGPVDGHESAAGLVVGGVEGNGQREL